jgi:hypothetical protein
MAIVDAGLRSTCAYLQDYFNVGSLRLTEADVVMPPATNFGMSARGLFGYRCGIR